MFSFKKNHPILFPCRFAANDVLSWTQKDFVQNFFQTDERLTGVVAVNLGWELAAAVEAQAQKMQNPLRVCRVMDLLCYSPSDEQRVFDLSQLAQLCLSEETSHTAELAKGSTPKTLIAQTDSAVAKAQQLAEEVQKRKDAEMKKVWSTMADHVLEELRKNEKEPKELPEPESNPNTATQNVKVIKTYPAYDSHRFGIPWGALCDATGRPCFTKTVARYTGSGGTGGALLVEEPIEGSVWVFGQKDFRANKSPKEYAVFRNGSFKLIPKSDLLAALSAAPAPSESCSTRQNQVLKILFEEIQSAEAECRVPCTSEILARLGITPEEASKYGNIYLKTPTEDI